MLIVNGVAERIRPALSKTHGRTASCTPFNSEGDGELAAVMEEMKRLPNVVETGDQSKAKDILQHPLAGTPELRHDRRGEADRLYRQGSDVGRGLKEGSGTGPA
ncbi:MAG: hypothetical protein LBP20_00595 [Treponema sp.]|nr:hypothetical protein [Treponema sp.]